MGEQYNKKQKENGSETFFLRNYISPKYPIWIDSHLQKEAVRRNYSILGLETLDEREVLQIEQNKEAEKIKILLGTDTSACTLAKNLAEYLKDREKYNFEPYITKIHRTYMSQNLKELEKLDDISKLQADTISLYDKQSQDELYKLRNKYSLDRRNFSWMKQLPSIMANRASFIAVGVAHLYGENGLINLLRKEGYTVEPVKDIVEAQPKESPKGIVDIRREKIELEYESLGKASVNDEWMNSFRTLVMFSDAWFGNTYTNETVDLIQKVPAEYIDKNEFLLTFYTRPHFSRGNTIADLALIDESGNKKHLLKIKPSDKYVMLCFWEANDWKMNQIIEIQKAAKGFEDKLEIVYVNIDEDINKWKNKSNTFNFGKYNFRIDEQNKENLNKYLECLDLTIDYIPNYSYLISPNSYILDIQNTFYKDDVISLYIIP